MELKLVQREVLLQALENRLHLKRQQLAALLGEQAGGLVQAGDYGQ